MKKHSKFFTDSEGRVRYIGNDRKVKDTGNAQIAKTETAPQRGEKGNFITKDGKVIFIGGPGSGGGGASGTVSPSPRGKGFNIITKPDGKKVEVPNRKMYQQLQGELAWSLNMLNDADDKELAKGMTYIANSILALSKYLADPSDENLYDFDTVYFRLKK